MYKVRIYSAIQDIPSQAWNQLLTHADSSPFVRYEYLLAMEQSDSASPKTGWTPCHFTVWDEHQEHLIAAMPYYIKTHSYGEYVFDWAWANAYKEHGLSYYPKMLCAIPFTPVGGTRLLGNDSQAKEILLMAVKKFAADQQFSSIHVLFPMAEDESLFKEQGFMRRESVQFHWQNQSLERPGEFLNSFEEFLYTLNKKRRNNIIRERSSVKNAGISFEHIPGEMMTETDWDCFYECYAANYFNHGNAPYLQREFFSMIGQSMGTYLHIIFANGLGKRIATSLIFRNRSLDSNERAYGRYWGSTEYVQNLHFETAYYQNIEFCIDQKIHLFEGGAQGEHKMARALMPVTTYSAHWLAHPAFADAVERFLERERSGINNYLEHLAERSPFKQSE